MKKLLYILMAGWIAYVMALGCKKEPTEEATTENARGKSTANFYHTCADSWNETASQGLAAEVDVLKLRLGGSKIKSWWIAFYYQVNGERRWVQWGYAVDKSGLFPAFFVYRFPNGQGYQFAPIINYSGKNVPLAYNTKVRFEIKNKPGTTFWSFMRNGQEVFEADLECTEATGSFQACTESWGDNSFSPALTTYYMEVLKEGQWTRITTGISNGFAWGIQGKEQNNSFNVSQFIMGGNTPLPTIPAWLWGKP